MKLRISHIREEAPGVKTFTLHPALPYKAGQFLSFDFYAYGSTHRRSYSLSSSPDTDADMQITLKRVPNGLASRLLIDDALEGDALECSGEGSGVFTLPQNISTYSAVWLFAAGIGITPILSLLKSLLLRPGPRVVLVYSNKTKQDAVFYDALQGMEAASAGRLRIVWLFSDTKDLRRARFSKEYFPELHKQSLQDDPLSVLCYTCGPASYMWLVQLLLQDAGVPAQNIRREVFVIDKKLPKHLPADKESHFVDIEAGERRLRFLNNYPESILASAKAAGIHLPYSCETGQCGSCTALCVKGKVWMSYNEVLTDKDIDAGRVLTCTGHAIGGDVELRY